MFRNPLIFIVAGFALIIIITLTIKDKFFPEKEEKKTEEEYAKETVDKIIRKK